MKIICPKHGSQTGGMHVSPDLAKFIMEGGELPAFRQITFTFDGEYFPWGVLVTEAFSEKRHLPRNDVVPCGAEQLPRWYEELAVVCLKCIEDRGITLR